MRFLYAELISGIDTDKVNPYIEKLIAVKEPLVKVGKCLNLFQVSLSLCIVLLSEKSCGQDLAIFALFLTC